MYVNLVTLEFGDVSFSDFESFTDNARIPAKSVNLMNKTGHAKMTQRYGFTVTAKVPAEGWPIDLDNIAGGTCTVEYEANGKRTTYRGVYSVDTGDATTDGETKLTVTKTFSAESRIEE